MAASGPLVQALIALASTPAGCPLDESLMVVPKMDAGSGSVNLVPLAEARPPAAAAEGAAANASGGLAETSKSRLSGKKAKKGEFLPPASSSTSAAAGAASTMLSMRQDMIVGAAGEGSAVRMRMATSLALGQLIKRVHNQDACSDALNEVLNGLASPLASSRSFAALVVWHWAGGSSAAHVANGTGAAVSALLGSFLSCPGGAMQPNLPVSPDPYTETVPYLEQVSVTLWSQQEIVLRTLLLC